MTVNAPRPNCFWLARAELASGARTGSIMQDPSAGENISNDIIQNVEVVLVGLTTDETHGQWKIISDARAPWSPRYRYIRVPVEYGTVSYQGSEAALGREAKLKCGAVAYELTFG